MNYFPLIESFRGYGSNEALGIFLLLAVPILLVIALVFFIAGVVKKNNSAKMFKISAISFLVAGVSALIGLGQCGGY